MRHAGKFAAILVDLPSGVMMLMKGSLWRQAHLIVVGIVSRGDFDGSGAKFCIDEMIGDDRNVAFGQAAGPRFADQMS